MRRDIQLLVPLVLFGLSFLAVVMGLLLLTGLKWEAVLEDVGLVETTEISFSIPLPTSSPTQAAAGDPVVAKVVEPSPTEMPIVRKALASLPHEAILSTGLGLAMPGWTLSHPPRQ